MATVLLLRHGRTTSNASGILAGWTPGIGLDETGRVQAAEARKRLEQLPIVRIVSSPLQRCQETAAAVAEGLAGLAVDTDERLGECRYGAWTGRTLSELTTDKLWRTVQDHPSAATFPPSPDFEHESLAAMSARAVSAVRALDAEVDAAHGPNALWVAVSHGDVLKAVLADALGSHLDQFQRIVVGPASISVVRYTARRPFVLRVNDSTGELTDLVTAPEASGPSGDATPGGETGTGTDAADAD
ncbi:MSMEG_4193 family putative phosphomutase [Flexivirga caeni]|uniref:MSMEG_4193 family putative phosphomutase n=1 Tax=Flexivirga caeni TaxID=2294115 RepID=A0A3M9MH51_9MICO|nr:MSMEG_4193 family putative phosphomutase [Flexivirga caeni]RNI24861.1 MSMEG_4193 family putative phosphomutase [Flexivirga caeni]